MAYQIRISPNALRASAERQLTVSATVDDATARLSNLVTVLNAAWDGSASTQALEDLRKIREDVADIAQGTAGNANKLKEIAQVFENLDEALGIGAVPIAGPVAEAVTRIVGKSIWQKNGD